MMGLSLSSPVMEELIREKSSSLAAAEVISIGKILKRLFPFSAKKNRIQSENGQPPHPSFSFSLLVRGSDVPRYIPINWKEKFQFYNRETNTLSFSTNIDDNTPLFNCHIHTTSKHKHTNSGKTKELAEEISHYFKKRITENKNLAWILSNLQNLDNAYALENRTSSAPDARSSSGTSLHI